MRPFSRTLAMAIVVAHAAVVLAPCAGVAADAVDARGRADHHGFEASHHDAPADAHHAEAVPPAEECGGHEERTPIEATAPCPCGCEDGPASGTPGSRVGFALWVFAPAPLVAAPLRDFAALAPRMPAAPPERRDPVPI